MNKNLTKPLLNFENLVEEYGSRELVKECIDIYFSTLEDYITQLKKSWAEHNRDQFNHVIHKLKGGLSCFERDILWNQLDQLERASSHVDFAFHQAQKQYDELWILLEQFHNELKTIRQQC